MKLRFTPSLALSIFSLLTPIAIITQALITIPFTLQGIDIPVGHLFELVVTSSVVITTFSGVIISYLFVEKIKPLISIPLLMSFGTLGLYGLGNGIHFSANSLHHFIITNRISGELQAIAYFYDEQLSHIIWIPSLLLFPVCVLVWEFVLSRQLKKVEWLGAVAGSWYGFFTGIIALESQLMRLVIPLLTILLTVCAILGLSRPKTIKTAGGLFCFVSLIGIAGTIVCWRLLTGGFPEPLEVLF